MTIQTSTETLDQRIADAVNGAVVVWRGERIAFPALPERIARVHDRIERDGLYRAYLDAVEALNPLFRERLDAWVASDPVAAETKAAGDPRALAVDLERFSVHAETPYFAALRRYLAQINIEQGDATVADLWHVVRGNAWANWFGPREVARAAAAAGRGGPGDASVDGWRAAQALLAGAPTEPEGLAAEAVGEAYGSLVGDPTWLRDELGVADDEVALLTDFLAFVRLLQFRRALGELQFELRLYGDDQDPAVQRAYYGGILSHIIGVEVPGEAYLHAIPAPFASAHALRRSMLATMLTETASTRLGPHWWRDPAAAELTGSVAAARDTKDALARLGYDALDWRPVLRQIRTRLIGEMSGYGGPNITTRAGTRKV